MSEQSLSQTIDTISQTIESFKADHAARLDRMETRLNRPGAFHAAAADAGEARYLQTADGHKLPMLSEKQRVSDLQRGDDSDGFSLGGFVRDAIVGSRKAASGPALVPTFLSGNVIDSVRRKTVLVNAGASTILIDGPTNLARITQDPTVYQHTEAATDIVESDILATPISLNPKLLAALVPLTVELVSDSPNLDAVLTTALTGAFAAKLDALGLATLLADTDIPKSLVTQDPAVWLKVLGAVGSAMALNQDVPRAHCVFR